MKKLTLLVLFAPIMYVSAQNKLTEAEYEKDDTLEKKSVDSFLNRSIKEEFSTLLGFNANGLNSGVSTDFNKKETSITAKVLLTVDSLNKKNFNTLFTTSLKIGESNNFLDLGNSDMPLGEARLAWHWIPYKRIFFVEKNSEKLITFKRYFWTSMEFTYLNSKYTIFDITRTFSDQLFEENFSSLAVKGGLNFYAKWNKEYSPFTYTRPHFFFFNINYQFSQGNNVNEFTKLTITDYVQINDSSATRRVSSEKTAYQGQYKEFQQHLVSSEILIGVQKYIILDLFADVRVSDTSEPVYSRGGGIYFLVKKEKGTEEKNVVNLGIFIKQVDNNEPYLGFKTSLPIGF